MLLPTYLFTCAAVAWLGRRRMLGFWGNFLLSFFMSPIAVALMLFIGTSRPSLPSPTSTRPVTG